MERRKMIGLSLGLGAAISGIYLENSHAAINTTAEVTASVLNLRSITDSNEVIGKLTQGSQITILKDFNDGFVHVRTNNGKEGKCSKKFLNINDLTNSSAKQKYVVSAEFLNVRKGAGVEHFVTGFLRKGDSVNKISSSNGWAKIEYSNGKTGYCADRYLKKASDSNTSQATIDNKTQTVTESSKKSYNNVVSVFTTTYATGCNRATNIELAVGSINNTIIKPGGVFDFKETVGETSLENGYLNAPFMANGVIAGETAGGGICQVSSTLYAAALKAGLTDISARTHSGRVSYMTPGLDAVISSTSNLRIRNTYQEDIVIKASCSGGVLTIKFVSVNPLLEGKTYELKSQALPNSNQYKLFLMEKKGNISRPVYSRTSNYVR